MKTKKKTGFVYTLKQNKVAYAYIAPFYILFAIFGLFPIVAGFALSLFRWDGIGPMHFNGVTNYINLFKDPLFWKALSNTLLIGIIAHIPILLGGLALAYILNSKLVKGENIFKTIYFMPMVTSSVAISIIFQKSRTTKKPSSKLVRTFCGPVTAVVLTIAMLAGETVYLVYAMRATRAEATASSQYISVSAHRGGARKAPENTMSAIKYAVDSMSDYAEIDVQETSDGEIVLMHDTNLKRTTGLNASIWTLTYDEISQLDAGVRFNKKFRGEQIPKLEEVIAYAKGKIILNIEVKYNGHNQNIVKKVVKIIEDNDFVDQCVLTSMNYNFLRQAKKINPDIKTGYTMKMSYGGLEDMDAADFFSVKYTYITESFVEHAHSLGKEVCAWTQHRGHFQPPPRTQ